MTTGRTKIGVTGLRGIPGVMGGIEAHAEELYPRLHALRPGWDIEIAVRSPYVDPALREYRGLQLRPTFTVRNKYAETLLHTFLALFDLRFGAGCDVVHIHAIGPGLLAPLARLLGMKVVLTHHGQDYARAKWGRGAKSALRMGEWLALRASNEVIVVSSSVADTLRARFPNRREHIHAIPNGAGNMFRKEGVALDRAVLDSLGLQPRTYILGVGRLVPEKGFDDLIAAHAAASDPRTLVIAGKSDHEDDYARRLLAKAGDRVVFAGFQPHAALRTLYAGADLFVLPSHHEGLPIAALEAAAVGGPMLLSDIPANVEVGLDTHNYYRVGDIAALARKLAEPSATFTIDSPAIRERFDWDTVAAATAAVFDRLVVR